MSVAKEIRDGFLFISWNVKNVSSFRLSSEVKVLNFQPKILNLATLIYRVENNSLVLEMKGFPP